MVCSSVISSSSLPVLYPRFDYVEVQGADQVNGILHRAKEKIFKAMEWRL